MTNGMNPGAVEATIRPDHAEHLARFHIPLEMLVPEFIAQERSR